MRRPWLVLGGFGGLAAALLAGTMGCIGSDTGPRRIASKSDVTMVIIRRDGDDRIQPIMVMSPYHIKFFGTANVLTVKGGETRNRRALRALGELPLREMSEWNSADGAKYLVEVFYDRRTRRGFILDDRDNPLASWFAEHLHEYSRYMWFDVRAGESKRAPGRPGDAR